MIFAHVEDKSGLWREVGGTGISTIGKDKSLRRRILGFQKVRSHDKPDKPCRKKVQEWLGDWYPAEVEGSDPKSLEDVVEKNSEKNPKSTWIRIGDPSFQAVKFALTDHENRIRSEQPPKAEHAHIKSIRFTGGILDSRTIGFSSALNTLIGIRGSGKSSILEALRYVLDIPFGENANDTEYKKKLAQHTFGSGGKAEILGVDNHGEEFQIRRVLNHPPQVRTDGEIKPGVMPKSIIRNPVYYGQKDLASSGEGFGADLIEKLAGHSLAEVRDKIEQQKQIVKDSIRRWAKLSDIDAQIQEYTQKKQNAEFHLERYAKHGVAEKLKTQTDLERDHRRIKEMLSDIASFTDDLENLLSAHEDSLKNHASYRSLNCQNLFGKLFDSYRPIPGFLDELGKNIVLFRDVHAQISGHQDELGEIRRKRIEEFAEVRRTLEADLKDKGAENLNLEEFPQLKSQIDAAAKMLEALKKQKDQKISLEEELRSELSRLSELWKQEFEVIETELERINKKDTAIRIKAKFRGDTPAALEFMKSLFRGSGIHTQNMGNLVQKYADFIEMYRDFPEVRAAIPKGSQDKFTDYFMKNTEEFLTYRVPDHYTISYRDKDLQNHSLGERASALILFVLNQQDSDLLIIDQPEDDLDNQTIYEDVIKTVRRLKPDLQFIFATHNANFPVLGDADQIHSCRYSNGSVEIQSGSIDAPALQKEIVDIMEGGERAFARRKEIYGIWKLQNS